MKVAFVAHPGRPCYEFEWLAALPAEEVRILDVDFQRYPRPPMRPIKYCKVGIWDSHLFGSTARLARYRGFQGYLDDVDVVLVLEAFSSLSHQFVSYCFKRGIPVVVLTYEVIARHPIYRLFPFSQFTRATLAGARAFVCVTLAAKSHLMALGVAPQSLFVVSPGVDTARFLPRKDSRAAGGVIFVGRLEDHKGIDVVMEVFHSVVKPDATRHMTIVGDGNRRRVVERAAAQNRNLRFLPRVRHADMPGLYAQHAVFALPARDTVRVGWTIGAEQFGFALVEAMACGLLVVTSDCGAIPEVVGNGDWVCRQRDLDEFPSYVESALSGAEWPEVARANRRRARTDYELHTQANRLYECLTELSSALPI
jgi:glycosyltransferase involved in cell wall biosynthesis